MLINYFKTAWRNILRNPLFSLINIAGLAIGLSCCILIILYTKDEVSFDRFHSNVNNLYRLTYTMENLGDKTSMRIGSTNISAGEGFQRHIPEIAAITRLHQNNCLVKQGNNSFSENVRFTDQNFFTVFSFPLKEGQAATALANEKSIVITEETAQKYFGTTNAVGKSLQVNITGDAFETFIVSAVAQAPPQNSTVNFTMLVPFSNFTKTKNLNAEDWMSGYLNTFVLLRSGADAAAVQSKFASVFNSYAGEMLAFLSKKFNLNVKVHYGLQPFTDIHLSKVLRADNGLTGSNDPMQSYILSGIALFILLIACFNFVNITVAQSLRRAKEIGIRKVTGGMRRQLLVQFLAESFLVCLLAFLLALVIAYGLLPVFNELADKKLSLSYLFDGTLVVGFVLLLCVTTLIAGIYPGWVLSGFNPIAALYNRFTLSGRHYFARSLVVFQFVLSTFLIIATITIYSQIDFLLHKDLGYNNENMVRVKLPHNGNKLMPLLKDELKKYPGIEKITGRSGGQNILLGEVDGKNMTLNDILIDDQFVDAFQLRLVQGRNLLANESGSVLINETFAKQAGWKDPVGRYFSYKGSPDKKYLVAGLVKDFHFLSLRQKIEPLVLHQFGDRAYNELWVKIRPGHEQQVLQLLETTYKKLEPIYPYEYQFINELNERQYEGENRWKLVISFAAAIVIFISCMGLFGLSALAIRQRTKEIGVRKVLGASIQNIIPLLSMSYCRLVLIAVLISFPLAWWAMNKWLQDFAYRIHLGWEIFIMAGFMAVCIAMLTVSMQALKAALANPVKSLRTE